MNRLLARLSPTDIIVASYCLLTTILVLVFGRPLSAYFDELAFYSGCLVLAVFVGMYINEEAGRLAVFVRLAYPVILFPFFYSMTQGLIFLFTDSFQDASLVALEQRLFGVELTRLFDQSTPNVMIGEVIEAVARCRGLEIAPV